MVTETILRMINKIVLDKTVNLTVNLITYNLKNTTGESTRFIFDKRSLPSNLSIAKMSANFQP